MLLALLFGAKGDKIKGMYKAMRDDIECDSYHSIPDLISASEARGIVYDRVIIVSSVVKANADKDFELLNEFARSTPASTYVLLSKKGVDDEFANKFISMVMYSYAVAMLVSSTTQLTLEDALNLSADEISAKYGCTSQQVQIAEDGYVQDNYIAQESSVSEEVVDAQVDLPKKPQKKQNFFQRYRAVKQMLKEQKEAKSNNTPPTEVQVEKTEKQQISENSDIYEAVESYDNSIEDYADSMGVEETVQGDLVEEQQPDFTADFGEEYTSDDDFNIAEFATQSEDFDENYDTVSEELSSDGALNINDFYSTATSDIPDFGANIKTFAAEDDFDEYAEEPAAYMEDLESTRGNTPIPEFVNDIPDFSDITPIEDNTEQEDFIVNEADFEEVSDEEDIDEGIEFIEEQNNEGIFPVADEPVSSVITPVKEERTVRISTDNKRGVRFGGLFKRKKPNITVQPSVEVSKSGEESEQEFIEPVVQEVETTSKEIEAPEQTIASETETQTTSSAGETLPIIRQTGEITEVDDLDELFDEDIGKLDEEYRAAENAKNIKVVEKVVERVIEKPVVSEGSNKSVLGSIYKGKIRKIILVTGARSSGITTLAYDIANFFSRHCPVLYVDGDTELHGLLNYVDYQRVTDYENTKLQGIRLCRSASAFPNCVIRFDRNFDLLTSDFFIETSDSEYETMQSVITDVARDYNVVVCDIPMSKLHLCEELISSSNIVLTTEMSRRGYMNLCCEFQSSTLRDKYKRIITSRGTLVHTKCEGKKFSEKDLRSYVSGIVEFEENDANWLSMKSIRRGTNIDDKFLNEILEG